MEKINLTRYLLNFKKLLNHSIPLRLFWVQTYPYNKPLAVGLQERAMPAKIGITDPNRVAQTTRQENQRGTLKVAGHVQLFQKSV
jgi:hypothetical protein